MRVKNCQLYAGLPICFLLNFKLFCSEKSSSKIFEPGIKPQVSKNS